MKSKAFPLFLTWLALGLFVLGCAGSKPSLDPGDRSSGDLIWGVIHFGYENKDRDKALLYADQALELYGAEARQIQASLSDFPVTDPPENVFKYNDLNHVAMAMLVKGDLLLEKGDRAGAEESFSMVIQDFGYAQVQDLGEWGDYAVSVPRDERGFVKIADVAQQRLADVKAGKN